MPAPMQISLEEIISMLLQRVEALSASDENSKTKQNIIYRALYKKGLITEEDILDSVKEEYRMLKELGVIQDEPSDDMYKTITDGILQWIKGDVEGIKKSMAEYEQKLREFAREEAENRSSRRQRPQPARRRGEQRRKADNIASPRSTKT